MTDDESEVQGQRQRIWTKTSQKKMSSTDIKWCLALSITKEMQIKMLFPLSDTTQWWDIFGLKKEPWGMTQFWEAQRGI